MCHFLNSSPGLAAGARDHYRTGWLLKGKYVAQKVFIVRLSTKLPALTHFRISRTQKHCFIDAYKRWLHSSHWTWANILKNTTAFAKWRSLEIIVTQLMLFWLLYICKAAFQDINMPCFPTELSGLFRAKYEQNSPKKSLFFLPWNRGALSFLYQLLQQVHYTVNICMYTFIYPTLFSVTLSSVQLTARFLKCFRKTTIISLRNSQVSCSF